MLGRRQKAIRAAVFAVAVAFPSLASSSPISGQEIDRIAATAIKAYDIPGISIAVVQPGQPVHAKGYGVIDDPASPAVGARTLFGIGSISKAFTTTLLAMLVEEGKLHWDDPVIKYIPEFRMSDPWVTRQFTVRDLLTHRSGLAPYAGDLVMLIEDKANRPHVYRALANLPAATSFRSQFAYDNLLYIVAGDLIERVSRQSWQDFVTARILTPLGMTGCVADQTRIPASASRAAAHDFDNGKLTRVDFPLPAVTVPAGGIFCNAEGMAHWLAFNLGQDDRVKLAKAEKDELFTPVTPIPAAKLGGGSFASYGLGWLLRDRYGQMQARHGGGLPGMVSFITVFPRDGVGIMVMTNRTSGAAEVIANQIADRIFMESTDDKVTGAGRAELAAIAGAQAAAKKDTGAGVDAALARRPALPLERYAGRYSDQWFGDATVAVEGNALRIDLGGKAFSARLRHLGGDTFVAEWSDRSLNADAYVSFVTDAVGRVTRIAMTPVSKRTDPSYGFASLNLVKIAAAD